MNLTVRDLTVIIFDQEYEFIVYPYLGFRLIYSQAYRIRFTCNTWIQTIKMECSLIGGGKVELSTPSQVIELLFNLQLETYNFNSSTGDRL